MDSNITMSDWISSVFNAENGNTMKNREDMARIKSEPISMTDNEDESTNTNPQGSSQFVDEATHSIPSGEQNCNGHSEWRPLRSRSFLTDSQISLLSGQYKRNPFPSKYEMSALAEQINVNKRVVQVHFILISLDFIEFYLLYCVYMFHSSITYK